MFRGRVASWNLRDRQMADTLDVQVAHVQTSSADDAPTKVVVWAHNPLSATPEPPRCTSTAN